MSEPIKVGDLVMVIKPKPCCGNGRPGYIFTILEFRMADANSVCCHCDVPVTGIHATHAAMTGNLGVDIRRLKRIPPLSELEGEKRKEELTA